MDYAILVKDENNSEIVFIKHMEALGKEYARSCRYVCADENCNVIMRPIFPGKQRKKGKEVHSPHFRAQPQNHITGCRAIKNKAAILSKSTGGKDKNKIYDTVKRSLYPIHYANTERRTIISGGGATENIWTGDGRRADGISPKIGSIHISEPKSNNVKRFAEAFEDFYEHRRTMKFKLTGCPARNYADGFFRLTKNETRHLDKLSIYIYFGHYLSHTLNQSGTSILFGASYVNRKRVGIWIPVDLYSEALWTVIFERLKKASLRKDAIVYVAGRFINHQNWKYSIELNDLRDIWVGFPEDRRK